MNVDGPPENDQLPFLHGGLSQLPVSDWVHSLRLAVGGVEDFSAGPVVTWTEGLGWGWVTWAIDTSYGFRIPRPEHAVAGHIYVYEMVMPDPAARASWLRRVASRQRPEVSSGRNGQHLEDDGVGIQLMGACGGVAGGAVGAALSPAIDVGSFIPTFWGAVAGAALGAVGWIIWRRHARVSARTWHVMTGDVDVPVDLATITGLHEQLQRVAPWINDREYTNHLHRTLHSYRWGLLDPSQVLQVRANLNRLHASIQYLVASAQEAGESAASRQGQILAELEAAYPVDTAPGDDGAADQLQARIAALRELHGLDQN